MTLLDSIQKSVVIDILRHNINSRIVNVSLELNPYNCTSTILTIDVDKNVKVYELPETAIMSYQKLISSLKKLYPEEFL